MLQDACIISSSRERLDFSCAIFTPDETSRSMLHKFPSTSKSTQLTIQAEDRLHQPHHHTVPKALHRIDSPFVCRPMHAWVQDLCVR